LWTVHLPVSPLSTLWTGPCWWVWVRARFFPMTWVSTSEVGFGGLFAGYFGWVFWATMGHLILEDWYFDILCSYFYLLVV
jgi:hypothetical protein